MPLNLSFTHMMVIGIVALVVLGPERLPGVARTAGNLFREWKRISGGLEAEVRDVLSEFTEPFAEPLKDLRSTMAGAGGTGAGAAAAAAGVATVVAAAKDGAVAVPQLTPAIPTLGPGTGLVSPGPVLDAELPMLAPPPAPDTFVPFTPGQPGAGS